MAAIRIGWRPGMRLLRMMKWVDERCMEIGRALNGSRLGGKGKGAHFGLVG